MMKETEFKTRGFIRMITAILLILLLPVRTGAAVRAPQSGLHPAAEFQLTMLDVGQGLSILCESDGEYLLYDGGGRNSSSYVVSYLKKHGIEKLRYIIASHYDEDHIAGLIGVLNTTEVGMVLAPHYEVDTSIYQSFKGMIARKDVQEMHPAAGTLLEFGNASCRVIGPVSEDALNENNHSLAVSIEAGDFRAVLTGDAEYEEEQEIVDAGLVPQCDLYVVGHHGSASSSSYALLDAMQAAAAFISVGEDNSYGHPAEKTLSALQSREMEIYRSDLQGEVTCYAAEGTYWFSEEETADNAAADRSSEEQTAADRALDEQTTAGGEASEQTYILNTNTRKFHYPDCRSVKQMKDHNKQEFTGTREELLEMGYESCGNCMP
ncbi:MAG: MBL fold metallo-hydrolase [Lachnospiraceae bacterium]|nr:MBL fold metallo-hydrolase [Lachnospiraceae bacterium]